MTYEYVKVYKNYEFILFFASKILFEMLKKLGPYYIVFIILNVLNYKKTKIGLSLYLV